MASKEVERPKEQGVGKCQGWQGAPDTTFGAVPADLAIISSGTLAKVAEEGWVEAKTNSLRGNDRVELNPSSSLV